MKVKRFMVGQTIVTPTNSIPKPIHGLNRRYEVDNLPSGFGGMKLGDGYLSFRRSGIYSQRQTRRPFTCKRKSLQLLLCRVPSFLFPPRPVQRRTVHQDIRRSPETWRHHCRCAAQLSLNHLPLPTHHSIFMGTTSRASRHCGKLRRHLHVC